MEEAHVGGVEEGDSEGEPDAHEEVLQVVGRDGVHGGPDGVDELGEDPVAVQEDDGRKGQKHASDSHNGGLAVEEAEEHAASDEGRPCQAEADVEDAQAVPVGRRGWEVVNGQVFHGGVHFPFDSER